MVKLMGAVLVAAGCGWLGFQGAEGLRRRVRALRDMAGGLLLLERELELGAPPLPGLMDGLSARRRPCLRAAGRGWSGCLRSPSPSCGAA